MMKLLGTLLTTLFALAIALAAPRPARAAEMAADLIRIVELQWEQLSDAVEYEFEMDTNPDFTSTIYDERLKGTKFRVNVLPGAYYYRVRGIDKQGREGRWSAVSDLNVNARPPVLLSPPHETNFQGNLYDSGIETEWRSSGPGIRYLVEIKSQDSFGKFTETVVKQETTDTEFPFFPQEIGRYQWSVHTLGAGGDEPGQFWEFNIEGVVPRGVKTPPGMVAKRVVRYVPPWWRGHWTLFARYGQASLGYSIVDQDLRSSGSFTGFTGLAIATLNWEWHDPVRWLLGGIPWWEAEYETDRQTVLGESVMLPRKHARLGFWFDDLVDKWRFSPVVEYGQKEIAIYQVRSPVKATRANSIRDRLGFGVAAEYQLKSYVTVAASAKLFQESGGEAGFYTIGGNFNRLVRFGELMPASAMELVGSGTLALGKRIRVQGRLRYESSKAEWRGFFPTQSGDPITHVNFTNISFDLGVGIKF